MTKTEHAEAKARCEALPSPAGPVHWVRTSILNGTRKDTEAALEMLDLAMAIIKDAPRRGQACAEWLSRRKHFLREWDGGDSTLPNLDSIRGMAPTATSEPSEDYIHRMRREGW